MIYYAKVYDQYENYLGEIENFTFDNFSKTLNQGAGEVFLDIKDPDLDIIKPANLVKIIVKNENHPKGKVVYTGEINLITPIKGKNNEYRVNLFPITHELGRTFLEKDIDIDDVQEGEKCGRYDGFSLDSLTTDGDYIRIAGRAWNDDDDVNELLLLNYNISTGAISEDKRSNYSYINKITLWEDVENEKLHWIYTWSDQNVITTAVSDTDGSNFSSENRRTKNSSAQDIQGYGDKMYALYSDWANKNLYLGEYDKDGTNYSETKLDDCAGTADTGLLDSPTTAKMSIYKDKVYVLFLADDANYTLTLGICDLDGSNWTTTEIYTPSSGTNYNPQITILNDVIYYAWTFGSSYDFRLAKSDLDGSNLEVISDEFSYNSDISIDNDGHNIYFLAGNGNNAVWHKFNVKKSYISRMSIFANSSDFLISGDDVYTGKTSLDRFWGDKEIELISFNKEIPKTTIVKYSATKPSLILKDVIKEYNKDNKIKSIIETTDDEENQTYEFAQTSWLDVIEKCREMSEDGVCWNIEGDNTLRFCHYSKNKEHIFEEGVNCVNVNISKDISQVVNQLYFYSDNQETGVKIYKEYKDKNSILKYKKRAEFVSDDRWSIEENVDDYANQYLSEKKNPKTNIEIDVFNYDIESIEPGDKCILRGYKNPQFDTDDLIITEVIYLKDKVTLRISPISNIFGQLTKLSSRIASQEIKELGIGYPKTTGIVGIEPRNILGQIISEGFENPSSTSQNIDADSLEGSLYSGFIVANNSASDNLTEAREDTEIRPDSRYSAKYTANTSAQTFRVYKEINAYELRQKVVSFTLWVKTDQGGVNLSIQISGTNNTQTLNSSQHTGSGDWEQLYIRGAKIIDDAEMAQIGFSIDGLPAGESVYIDNLMGVYGEKTYGYQPFYKANENVIHVQDQKPQGTTGGTFTSGAWRVRTLNTTIKNTISGASLASNTITLPAGSYYIEASAPAYRVGYHKAILYDKTATVTLLYGTSECTSSGDDYTQTRSFIRGFFTLTVESDIEIWHKCSTTYSIIGLGVGSNLHIEVYTDVIIWRVG